MQVCPVISLVLVLDLTSPSQSPECNPRYSEHGGTQKQPERRRELTCQLEAAMGDTPFHDQILLITGPSSCLLTCRRHLLLHAKNNRAVTQKC